MLADFQPLTDDQWGLILKLMELDLPPERGIKRSDLRKVWNSIFFILRKGCRWIDLPEGREVFVPRSTAHGWLKKWSNEGVFDKVMSGLLQVAIKKDIIDLSQVSVDGSFSPFTGRGSRGCSRL
jgi:transposase